jgi:hypothetical protein
MITPVDRWQALEPKKTIIITNKKERTQHLVVRGDYH